MTATPHQILSAARLLIIERAPYFRAGVLQIVPRETAGLGTFATTKNWIMLWDPEKALEYGVEGTAAVIVHELWHLIRDHHGRFSAPLINQDIANIAGDLSINPGVVEMGFKLPGDGLWPRMFNLPDYLTAEQYYEKLLQMNVQYAFSDGIGEDNKKFPDMTVIIEGCGSCSGRRRRDEPSETDSEGRGEAEVQRTRITIAKDIHQAQRGTVPGGLSRWSEEVLAPPKVRWQEKLARVCRAAVAFRPGSGHSTYSRVSRRQAGIGFGAGRPVLPSYRATVPRVAFLVDTSGSMRDDALARALSEAQGVLTACGAAMDVIACDAAVQGAKRVKSIKEARAMLKGGGGSNFCPAFARITAMRPKIDVIVAATDGDITVPDRAPPGIQVIWLLVQRDYAGSFKSPCAWGTTIEVE